MVARRAPAAAGLAAGRPGDACLRKPGPLPAWYLASRRRYRPGPRGEHNRAFAFQGAVRLVEAAARPRCLITVDDLQWADSTSLNLLGLLLRRVDHLGMVTAYQQDGAADLLAPETLPCRPRSKHIRLGPLPADHVRGLFSDPVLAQVILDQAGHTPFAPTEVVAALASQGAVLRDNRRWRLRTPWYAAHAVVSAGLHQCRRPARQAARQGGNCCRCSHCSAAPHRPRCWPKRADGSCVRCWAPWKGLPPPGWHSQDRRAGASGTRCSARRWQACSTRPRRHACTRCSPRRCSRAAPTPPRWPATCWPAATAAARPWPMRPRRLASSSGSPTTRRCGWRRRGCPWSRPPRPGRCCSKHAPGYTAAVA